VLFLLAAIGRGMNDVAFRAHAIQSSMEQMLHAAALPILSDVQLVVSGLSHLQLFPDPIPDVFVGQPLLVSGKFAGVWPEQILLTGMMPNGECKLQPASLAATRVAAAASDAADAAAPGGAARPASAGATRWLVSGGNSCQRFLTEGPAPRSWQPHGSGLMPGLLPVLSLRRWRCQQLTDGECFIATGLVAATIW
jgi:hypothetical protein